jgi:hypothetical protein
MLTSSIGFSGMSWNSGSYSRFCEWFCIYFNHCLFYALFASFWSDLLADSGGKPVLGQNFDALRVNNDGFRSLDYWRKFERATGAFESQSSMLVHKFCEGCHIVTLQGVFRSQNICSSCAMMNEWTKTRKHVRWTMTMERIRTGQKGQSQLAIEYI